LSGEIIRCANTVQGLTGSGILIGYFGRKSGQIGFIFAGGRKGENQPGNQLSGRYFIALNLPESSAFVSPCSHPLF
jgi:hypothetical protein